MPATLKTFGNSMEPFFYDGDVLSLVKKPANRIKINDFITFKVKNLFITHRLIFKDDRGKYFITKGDNNPYPDKKVLFKQITGVVDSIKRGGQVLAMENLYLIQSTLYFQEITKVSNTFFAKRINFLILKGLPLHLYFEKEYPKRIYADCDFLIDKRHFDEVLRILRNLGFKNVSTPLSKIHGTLKDKNPEVTFYKKVNGINVVLDIHLEAVFLMTQLGKLDFLYPQKLIDSFTSELLEQKKTIKLQGFEFQILSPEHLVIYLSLHLFHHNFRGYYRYELLNKIVNKRKIDFEEMHEIIKKYRFTNFIYPVFYNLVKFYKSPIPKSFFNRIKSLDIRYIRTNILNINIFEDESRITGGMNRFKYIFYLSEESFNKKILIFTNIQVLYSIFWSIGKRWILVSGTRMTGKIF